MALRESGQIPEAKLLTSGDDNLLPRNRMGIPVENGGFAISPSNLFAAGDVRANENLALTSLHTLFMREHNRTVDELSQQNPSWTPEQLYQRSRKLVGAQLQAITYNEFLPAILGSDPLPEYTTYDPSIDPSVLNEFATVALRVGHSMLPNDFRRILDDGTVDRRDPVTVDSPFQATQWLRRSEDLDLHLKGLALEPQETVDVLVVNELRNSGPFDLLARDIQRGRDHGLADYNSMRQSYGLPAITSFAEITSDEDLQMKLGRLYSQVDDMDAFVGVLAEDHLPGASVGPLTAAIFQEQFRRLRDGDRFWYENDGDLSPEVVDSLASTRLSDIIRRNTDIKHLQGNVFLLPDPGDFDANGMIGSQDVDLLCHDVGERRRNRRDASRFDLTGDLDVDVDDLAVILDLADSLPGDANLDGIVQFDDFSQLAAGFAQGEVWSNGDFDCNHEVNFDDFAILANNFGATRSSMASVPSPNAWLLGLAALMNLCCQRSRCGIDAFDPKTTLVVA